MPRIVSLSPLRLALGICLLPLCDGLPAGTAFADVVPGSLATFGEPEARVEALSGRIICNCDCGNKIVQKCYCGTADSLRGELRSRVDAGDSDDAVLAHFVSRYGEAILASPAPEGFNLTAWAVPAAALLAGVLCAALLLRRWRRLAPAGGTTALPPSSADPSDPYEKAFESEMAER